MLLGHSAASLLKASMGKGGGLSSDLTSGLWLASAAFCSGSLWQPTVNFLHDAAGCSFAETLVGTGAVTGLAFFFGLRAGRVVYSPLGLPGCDYANLTGDAMLSASIGAATGTFVGTDVSFSDNLIRPAFGIEEGMTNVTGMVTAGASTSAGFMLMQSAQNAVLPRGANWLDPVSIPGPATKPARAPATTSSTNPAPAKPGLDGGIGAYIGPAVKWRNRSLRWRASAWLPAGASG